MAKVVVDLNIKGGVGKSTAALNISKGLADAGKKTLLVDFDPQGSTTGFFVRRMGEKPQLTVADLLVPKENSPNVSEVILSVDKNLWLLPSSLKLNMAEAELRLQTALPQQNRLKKILSEVQDRFDIIVVDCGPYMNMLTINAIIVNDIMIVPVKPDFFAVEGFVYTTNTIKDISEGFEVSANYKILFNLVNRNNEEKGIIEDIRDIADGHVFKSQIRYQAKPIGTAAKNGKFVIEDTKAESAIAEDYREFLKELMGELE